MNREQIFELLQDGEFFRLAEVYLPKNDEAGASTYQKHFKNLFASAENGEMIVPILGLQGTGKSTLLNALLMDDIVLPVNAQETNCIAVEIRAGADKKPKMVVHFQEPDKHSIHCETPQELEQYVSDEFNHANEKKVSHAEIFISHPLLEDNLVFVDLPGVGSLTEQNVTVTMNYLKKQVGAIFLLKTYQPITRSEKVFLKTALAGMGVFWFVQNRWADEREEEVAEAVNHNKSILKTLINKPDYEPTIFVVNAKRAFESKSVAVPGVTDETGIDTFLSTITAFQNNWREAVLTSAVESFKSFILNLQKAISTRINDQQISTAQLEAELRQRESDYQLMMKRNNEKIDALLLEVNQFEQEAEPVSVELAKEANNKLRARMREVISFGVVDGEHLNRAFQENQQLYNEEAFLALSDNIFDFTERCNSRIEELEISTMGTGTATIGAFEKEEKLKYEKLFTPIGGTVGTLTGVYAGSAAAAALTGAGYGTVAGPVGFLVGAALGFIGAMIGSFFSRKIRDSRISVTMADLEAPLREARKFLQEHLAASLVKHSDLIKQSVDNFKVAEELNLAKLFHDAKERIRIKMDSSADLSARLNDDLQTISHILERF